MSNRDSPELADLIAACKRSDGKTRELAMEQLFARLLPFVEKIALSVVRRKLPYDDSPYHTAEDLASEAMLRFHKSFEVIRDTSTPGAWFTRVIQRIIIDRHRGKSAKLKIVLCEFPPDGRSNIGIPGPSPDIANALRQLPREHRQVIVGAYFYHLSSAEIADHLGMPVGTVKSRLHHALKHFNEIIYQDVAA